VSFTESSIIYSIPTFRVHVATLKKIATFHIWIDEQSVEAIRIHAFALPLNAVSLSSHRFPYFRPFEHPVAHTSPPALLAVEFDTLPQQ